MGTDRTIYTWAVEPGLPDIFLTGLNPAEAFLAAAPFLKMSLNGRIIPHQEELLVHSTPDTFANYCALLDKNLNFLKRALVLSQSAQEGGVFSLMPVSKSMATSLGDEIQLVKNALPFCSEVSDEPSFIKSFHRVKGSR